MRFQCVSNGIKILKIKKKQWKIRTNTQKFAGRLLRILFSGQPTSDSAENFTS